MTEGYDREGSPRRRRKSKANEDAAEVDEEPSLSGARQAKKRKLRPVSAAATSPIEESAKRRKCGANGASKHPRENLTEEQKRENHIKSEQKRRTLIKEGFDDLCDMVPGLKGGGFSKSVMLNMATDWLSELLRGNDQLREQLGKLS